MIETTFRPGRSGSPGEPASPAEQDPPVTTRSVTLGPVRLSERTTPDDLPEPGDFQLVLALCGDLAAVRPDSELALHDTSRPFPGCRDLVKAVAAFPKVLLPLPREDTEYLLARPIPARAGIGAVLSNHLRTLTDQHDYDQGTAERLGTITVDLVAALLAHELDKTAPHLPRHRELCARIDAYIRDHLGDPNLSPAAIAAVHHISVRHLHTLFKERDRTVAGQIRQHRLDRCRRDLADPALDNVPVGAVAARWGFTHPAHFSRLFRFRYGMSPSHYRSRSHGDQP